MKNKSKQKVFYEKEMYIRYLILEDMQNKKEKCRLSDI